MKRPECNSEKIPTFDFRLATTGRIQRYQCPKASWPDNQLPGNHSNSIREVKRK